MCINLWIKKNNSPSLQTSPAAEQFFWDEPASTDPGHDRSREKERRRRMREERWEGKRQVRGGWSTDMAAGYSPAFTGVYWVLLQSVSVGCEIKSWRRRQRERKKIINSTKFKLFFTVRGQKTSDCQWATLIHRHLFTLTFNIHVQTNI